MYLKKALIREPGYEIGRPAPMYLECACGCKVVVPYDSLEPEFPCECGIVYNAQGWIVRVPKK